MTKRIILIVFVFLFITGCPANNNSRYKISEIQALHKAIDAFLAEGYGEISDYQITIGEVDKKSWLTILFESKIVLQDGFGHKEIGYFEILVNLYNGQVIVGGRKLKLAPRES